MGPYVLDLQDADKTNTKSFGGKAVNLGELRISVHRR